MKDKIFENLRGTLTGVEKNIPLKDYTTFKIGGPAKYFFVAKTKEDLLTAVKIAKKMNLPIFILAGGSNLLVSDKGFKGLVINFQLNLTGSKQPIFNFQNDKIHVGAGTRLNDLVNFCTKNNLTGLEWAAGIPGTVGGAIFGNAQAFGEKISDAIETVEIFDTKTLEIKNFTKKQCKFSLKSSIFKKSKNLIIISAVFSPEKGDKEKINEKTKEFLNYRKNHHPMVFPSAGSMFVNPEKGGEIIRAGYLIEKVGLKGKKIGKAQISEQHANFIVNLGGAKAKDVAALIKLAQKKVKKTFDVSLETEVQIIGDI